MSLAARLHRSFRLIAVAVVLTLVVIAVMALLLLGRYHPEVGRATKATRALRLAHETMLDQETHLRGYLLTGDPAFLASAAAGREDLDGYNRVLAADLPGGAELFGLAVEVRLRQQRWISDWAEVVATRSPAGLSSFIRDGKTLFDDYRAAHDALDDAMVRHRDGALEAEGDVLLAGMLVELLIGASLLLIARREHRRLRVATVEPVEHLLTAIERVRDGDLATPVDVQGPDEVVRLGEGLNEMTSSLAEQGRVAAARADDVTRQAARLSLLLGMAREVAGSLSLRYVCEAVADAGRRVSGFGRVAVWLVDDDRAVLVPLYDSTRPKGATTGIAAVDIGHGAIGEAAQLARTAHDGIRPAQVGPGGTNDPLLVTELAIPMVVGASVIGVLQFTDDHASDLGDSDLEILETLAIHAAAAIESARLHRDAEEQAQVDALTRLNNRRRLDADLVMECDRSVRYQRPLALVMVDVDHFKRFNDRHGHRGGDEALQHVAAVLRDGIRASDSAYRYGGEEFVLLLREGTADGAVELAERLRVAVRERSKSTGEPVTASFGIAAMPVDGTSPEELLAAADAALYEAKRTGRNRVVCATGAIALSR